MSSKIFNKIPAISIQQPWAHCILHLGKNIENRKWSFNYSGPLLIHAGLKFDTDGYYWLTRNPLFSDVIFPSPDSIVYAMGGILGIIEMEGVILTSSNRWFFGPVGWKLENPREIQFIPYKGKQGIFYPEIDNITIL